MRIKDRYVIRQPEFRPKVQNLLLSDDGLVIIGKQIKNNKTLCRTQGVFFVFILRSKYAVGSLPCTDREGIVTHIDDADQIHGTWGGCAVIPAFADFIITERA